MRKNIQVKKYSRLTGGALPDTRSLKMTKEDVAALRQKFRSPFGFCGPRRAKTV